MSNFLNLPSAEQFDVQNTILASIASNISDTGIKIDSWKDLQMVTRMGLHRKLLKVRDVLKTTYDGTEKFLDVIGLDHDGENSITVQFRDCIRDGQFDAPEALYYASSAISAGKKVFELDSGKYEFTTTAEVPQGGQIVVGGWTDYVPATATTYASDRTTIIEDNINVVVSTGTANLSPVNHQQRCRYGSNNYKESAVRQWLNSDKETFVWVPQTNFDRPPSGYPTSGFLKLLQPELASVIVATEKQVAINTITDGGGQDTFKDKVFLLSRVEVGLGDEGTTTGESVYEFWDGATDADRIKVLGVSPRYWWLRSPTVGGAYNARGVNATGVLNNNYASTALGLSPACKIS